MEELLKQFNFTRPEILVYRALLKSGGATVSELAKAAGLKRTSCQEYIRSLEERGFINSSKVGNKFFYQAEDPDKFRQIVSERVYIVDRLLDTLRKKDQEEKWQVRSLTHEKSNRQVRRAKRKGTIIMHYKYKNAELFIVGKDKIILNTLHGEIGAVEVISKSLVYFHHPLLAPH